MLKKYLFAGLMLALFAVAGHSQNLGKVDNDVKSKMNAALTGYYAVKDALVDSDLEKTKEKAGDLVTLIGAISDEKMTAAQKEFWGKLAAPLKNDTEHIRDTGDLEHQRSHFMQLSNNFFSLVLGFKANSAEVYQHYCPMKRATWLSSSKEVKNPYYGDKMLDCGSVRTTLKKN
ncbi:MAG: DUF3347 domain-containing protein [Acidobacteria bacterium]|nr:DUF3347 domain-containing protein [Acidobacteriota bacterium]